MTNYVRSSMSLIKPLNRDLDRFLYQAATHRASPTFVVRLGPACPTRTTETSDKRQMMEAGRRRPLVSPEPPA